MPALKKGAVSFPAAGEGKNRQSILKRIAEQIL